MKTYDKLLKKAIRGAVVERALDIGTYPKSIAGGPNPYTKRTPYMNGWNACQSAQFKMISKIEDWLGNISAQQKEAAEYLLLNDVIFFSNENELLRAFVSINAVFNDVCDSEVIEDNELVAVATLHQKFDKDGIVVWVSFKRDKEPVNYLMHGSNRYGEAKQYYLITYNPECY